MRADLDDKDRIESFLMMNPSAAFIRKFLSVPTETGPQHRGFFAASLEVPSICTASFVTVTRERVFIIMLLNMPSSAFDPIKARMTPTTAMVLPEAQDIFEDVLGESINPEHQKGSYIAKWWK
jgi:hypothetical protein